ncbi:Chitin-inducible gibberellin-responsive protein 1-like protein [Drosera capensis]
MDDEIRPLLARQARICPLLCESSLDLLSFAHGLPIVMLPGWGISDSSLTKRLGCFGFYGTIRLSMDSSHYIRYGSIGNSTDSTYPSSSQLTPPSVPTALFESLKLNLRNSPTSPFLTHLDSDILATLSCSQEHQCSTGNLSGSSHSSDSPFEDSSQYLQSSSSGDCLCNTLLLPSGEILVPRHSGGGQRVEHVLQEIESELMETDDREADGAAPSHSAESRQPHVPDPRSRAWNLEPQTSFVVRPEAVHVSRGSNPWHESQGVESRQKASEAASSRSVPSGNLKQLLIECARALSENRLDDFERLVVAAKAAVSVSGEPIQRLGAYMIEGLVARKESSGTNIYRSLRCKEPLGKDLLSYMQVLYEVCPYLKFGYMAANGAIADACRTEDRIHIVDFQIAQGTQWLTLLQALAAKPGGPPHVRITGIDDPVSKYARGADLEAVGRRLAAISEKFHIPVEFHPIPVFSPDVTRDMLDVRPGEALAVNFPLQLHHTPDESVHVSNPRDGLLRMVKSLSPKVATLVEQESNTNTAPFFTRFIEALDFYTAMFESIDVTMPRESKERINVEQHCLAKDIVNVIACEGMERVERHELFGKWKSRFTMAGFQQYPLNSYVTSVIRGLLGCYSEHYSLVERDGAMLLGWEDRMLISASAWH